MNHASVNSSSIESIGYDEESETMEVVFVHGGKYQYDGISQEIYEAFLNAPSVGSYFHQHIKGRGGRKA